MLRKKLPKRHSKYQRKAEPVYKKWNLRKWLLPGIKILASIFVVSLVIYIVLYSSIFNISDIKISGSSEYVSAADLYTVISNHAVGKNIIKYDAIDLEASLATTFLGAKNFNAKKVYPKTLVVFVEERVPVAILQKEGQLDQYLIDDAGYVLGIISTNEYAYLPRLAYNGDISAGIFIDKDIVPKYIQLLNSLKEADIKVSSVSLYNDYTQFYTDAGVQVLISSEKIAKKYIQALAAVIAKAREGGQSIKKIDLRYDKVIVLFNTENK